MPFSFFPRIVYQTKSKISGEILVKEQFGQYKLYVQGTLQSGGIVESIWKKPLKRIVYHKSPAPFGAGQVRITNVLILGLGGGTVVKLIDKMYLKEDFVKIIGIEIDPEIIKVGKRYFGLDEIKNLQIIKADAFEWVASFAKDGSSKKTRPFLRKHFDLIIVDLYLGKEFPKKAENKKFLENIKTLLSQNGLAIFNRLRSRGEDLRGFEEKLRKYFSSVEKIKTATNFFFLVRS